MNELEARIRAFLKRQLTVEDRIFGVDLKLNEEKNLEWDLDRMDLVGVGGIENVAAALGRYMALPYGALRFAPGVGNFAWNAKGRWYGNETSRLLAYSIYKTLKQDARVNRIFDVRAVYKNGVAHMSFSCDLINGTTIPRLVVPFPG